jgi:DNA-binding HxlR family transcriptional regulator
MLALSFNCLAERLKELEQEGIIEKKSNKLYPSQTEYYLTEKGRRLNKIIFEMFNFALDEVHIKDEDPKLKGESKESLRVCLNMK